MPVMDVKTVEEKAIKCVRGAQSESEMSEDMAIKCVRGAQSRLFSVSRRLHPWVRIPLIAAAEAMYWLSLGVAGIIVCAFIFCFVLLLLGPYLAFSLLLYKSTPLSKSPENHSTGFLLLVGSFFFFFFGYRVLSKYPQLRNMENLSKLESIPVVLQISVYYAFLAFCSFLAALLTIDLLLVFYWACFGVFYAICLFYQMLSLIPWYVLVPFTVFMPLLVFSLLTRLRIWQTESFSAALDHDKFQHNLRLRRSLPV